MNRLRQSLPYPSQNFLTVLVIMAVSGGVAFFGAIDSNLTVFVFVAAGWVASVCIHEYGHALAAKFGGDYTIAHKGYLELDPAHFMEPIGSIVFPLLMLALGGIGLPGGAIFVQTEHLRGIKWRIIVALAGPFASFCVMLLIALPFAFGIDRIAGGELFWGAMAMLAYLQATAVVFNLLPIPGFDGYGVVEPFLPLNVRLAADRFRPITALIVLMLLFTIPAFGYFIFSSAIAMTDLVRVDQYWIGDGLMRFKFWRAYM
jgi:Zn-dependent protease